VAGAREEAIEPALEAHAIAWPLNDHGRERFTDILA